MKKLIIALSSIQICLISVSIGQNFTFHSNSPFGIQLSRTDSTRAAQTVAFHDYDNDGDQDIFLSGLDYLEGFDTWSQVHFFLEVQENIGTPQNPVFGERFELYQSFPIPIGYFFPAPGDLDDDGDVDFISAAEIDYLGNGKLKMFTNNSVPGPDQFDTSSVPSLDLPDFVPESFFRPELVDLDRDGDLDLMNSGIDPAFAVEDGPDIPTFYYARNIGSNQDPLFEGWYSEPYGLTPDSHGELLTSGDIDNDGDVDFLGAMMTIPGDSISRLVVHLNTPGANEKPAFHTPLYSPFGLPSLSGENQFAFPELVDIDGDGDQDLFVFLADPDGLKLQYYENTLCMGATNVFLEQTICEGESVTIGKETFSVSGNYTVYIQGSDGCDSIVDLALTVHEVDIAVVSDDNTLIADLAGANYQWFDCTSGNDIPGATQQNFTATVTGNYAVRITDQFGCTAVSTCIAVVVTSLEQDLVSAGISIFPNPGHGIFYIKNKTPYTASRISISDISGQPMIELIPDENKYVDVSILTPGIYIVKIRMNEFEVVKKLVVLN